MIKLISMCVDDFRDPIDWITFLFTADFWGKYYDPKEVVFVIYNDDVYFLESK